VDLTAEQPTVIKDYVNILHNRDVPNLRNSPNGSSSMFNIAQSQHDRLSGLYIFCGQSQDSRSWRIIFCAVLNLFHHTWPDGARYIPISDVVNNIYRFCPPAGPLRRFLAECHVDFDTGDWIPCEEQYSLELDKKKVLIGVLFRRDLPKYLSRTTRGNISTSKSLKRPQ
jgi:hypothetical protein